MKEAVPLVSNVSLREPALTATVIEARLDPHVSVATLTPFVNYVTPFGYGIMMLLAGLSNLRASGIWPKGSSPKSVNLDLVN
jgi:hypothetical protein